MLRLAGRKASIVGLLTASVSTGTLLSDPTERLASAVVEKLGWIREGAGKRYGEIELSLCPTIILTDNRDYAADQYIAQNCWENITVADVLEMPSVFIGSLQQIGEIMGQRRGQYGFSYYIVSDAEMVAVAPLVEKLEGQ